MTVSSTGDMRRAWAEVSEEALRYNVQMLRERYGRQGHTRLMAVVKADAYGHDVSLVASLCAEAKITDFGVATVDEGIRLRGLLPPESAIYLLAGVLPDDARDIAAHRLIPLVSDLDLGEALAREAANQNVSVPVHLDVDTGMGRSGVACAQAPDLLKLLDALPGLRVTGMTTHFANADDDPADAHAQNALFQHLVCTLGVRAKSLLLHASNSPATVVLSPSASYGLMRPGLLLYGIEPLPGMFEAHRLPLQPALALRARVLLCRPLAAGATISYGRTYAVPAGGGIYATVGIGYGDGFPRRLGGGVGHVLIHGRSAPICGRVCMDQCVIDVSNLPPVRAGDVATLIGQSENAAITVGEIASVLQTTPHEITTCLTARVPRVLTQAAESEREI